EGRIRIDTDGHSTSYAPGGGWFEAGPVPVFAQACEDASTRFIRVMVLPAALLGKRSISYVNAEDRDNAKSPSYKGDGALAVEHSASGKVGSGFPTTRACGRLPGGVSQAQLRKTRSWSVDGGAELQDGNGIRLRRAARTRARRG